MTEPIPTDDRPMPTYTTGSDEQAEALRQFAAGIAKLIEDGKCTDVVVFDVTGISQLTHYIVIASGTSDRQMKSVGRDVATYAKQHNHERYGNEEDEENTWIVVDLVDVMIHLFEPAMRAHYDLEMMWGDAPEFNWRKYLRETSSESA